MRKRWRIIPHDEQRIASLEKAAGVPPIVAQLLLGRGIYDPATIGTFLDPKLTGLRDPDLLPGLSSTADRLYEAALAKKKIFIYGDYDADGMTGTAILVGCLKQVGAEVLYHVPNRLDEGYGLNCDALSSIAKQGAQVVVSVDCGVASVKEALHAKQLGLELFITDHHEFADSLPDAAGIVHPRLPGFAYPFGGLCGAGVALKLAWGICQRASQSSKVTPALRDYLISAVGLAAIGTVADMVPLIDENRILVRHGLKSLSNFPCLGIRKLLEVTKLAEKENLTSEDIAFMLAPRLNAAGRFGQAILGVELLTTTNEKRAHELAEHIQNLNKDRDSLERSTNLAAVKQAKEEFDPENDSALVLAGRGWHAGVIGLVAGRIAEKFNRPIVLIAQDTLGIKPGTGSARTANGLNLHAALSACSEYLVSYGGHAAAAGLRVEDNRLEHFRAAFCEYAASEIPASPPLAELLIDAEGPLSQLTPQLIQQIDQLAPFGTGNPRPVLCATGVQLSEPPKRIGGGERHISMKLVQHRTSIRGVGFGFGDDAEELSKISAPLDIAFRPVINEFNGRRSVEIQLVDWRISQFAKVPTTV